MFGQTKYRVDRLEQCCKKLSDISSQQEKDTVMIQDTLTVMKDAMIESKETFAKHDKQEMAKYDDIAKALNKINKAFWIGLGIFFLAQLIGWDNVVQILTAKATGQ